MENLNFTQRRQQSNYSCDHYNLVPSVCLIQVTLQPRTQGLCAIPRKGPGYEVGYTVVNNLVPRACDPWEGNEGSRIIRCRKPGIVAKIELRIHFNGQSESSLKRIIPEPSFPSRGSQARGTRLCS